MSKHDPENLTHLKELIEEKRRQMIGLAAAKKGFLDPEVLRISKELDELILRFQRMEPKESDGTDQGDNGRHD